MSFDDCAIEPDQEIDLKQDPSGSVDYPLKAMKFSNITNLTIHVRFCAFLAELVQVCRNFGDDVTRIHYIGLRGEYQHDFRQKVS